MKASEELWQAGQRDGGKSSPSDSDAEFIGWQRTMTGEIFALYTVNAKQHPLYRSTVSETTLRQERLEIPPTPILQGFSKRSDYER